MDQAVWLYAGVVSVLIGLAIVASLVYNSLGANNSILLHNAVSDIAAKCDFVCSADIGTQITTNPILVSNSIIYANNTAVCYQYDNQFDCARCGCTINSYVLNLTDPAIVEAYSTHQFACTISRTQNLQGDVSIACSG